MVGLVVVSHSATLAQGVVELAAQMGGDNVPLEPAGGADGGLGTDLEMIQGAIGRVRSAGADDVLVLVDLGSAVTTAEMAAELHAMEDPEASEHVRLTSAPLVEGAVVAAALAGAGAGLDEVAAAARDPLADKREHIDDGGSDGGSGEGPGAGG